ncbi:MAG: class I mannose-6-phosphate isomerase [Pirellulales bacterium]|nr:class I mannose-6-phosphate isomerase [Pirellulales bacterium]
MPIQNSDHRLEYLLGRFPIRLIMPFPMVIPYPLRFQPIFRRYIWGGRRLATLLGKSIGDTGTCAESWEIVDHGDDQSIVTNGPFAGKRLTDLIQRDAPEFFGRHRHFDRFPLLFKFLDVHHPLSVQVHPDDAQAAQLDPPDLGKTEAWVVIASKPGSKIYAGLKSGMDRPALIRELARGSLENCLHSFEPQAGDCVLIPAGTVHATSEGLVIAEIQQASDTTFRLFDWNRVDAEGRPRPLHIEQALDAIDFSRGPVEPVVPQPTLDAGIERLIACDVFVLDRWQCAMPTDRLEAGTDSTSPSVASISHPLENRCRTVPASIGGDDRFHIMVVLEGTVELVADHQVEPLRKGGLALIPATLVPFPMIPRTPATILNIWAPDPSRPEVPLC